MSALRVSSLLANAYQLLDFSERLLDGIENQSLSELPRILQLLRKNIRDVKNIINDAEREFDEMVRKIDEAEEHEVLSDEEFAEAMEKLAREADSSGVML